MRHERELSVDLARLVQQVWPMEDDLVRVGLEEPPPGWRVVERYAVIPDARRAKFLVPLSNRRTAAASLRRFNRLRPLPVRVPRSLLGYFFASGVPQRLPLDRLTVAISPTVPEREWPDRLMLSFLSARAGRTLAAGVGVRRADPNQKPTLQLFDEQGDPYGYAKLGLGASAVLVDAEARALGRLPDSAARALQCPQVLLHESWQGRQLLVTSPLPATITAWRGVEQPGSPAALVLPQVGHSRGALEASGFWAGLTEAAGSMVGSAETRDLGRSLVRFLGALQLRSGSTELDFGTWHGDWVPWNIGRVGDAPAVWDWEHSRAGVPWGLDQAHWLFQTAFVLRGRDLPTAIGEVDNGLAEAVGPLGLTSEAPLLAELYVAELASRTFHLWDAGGGWNPGLYPALVPLLDGRLT